MTEDNKEIIEGFAEEEDVNKASELSLYEDVDEVIERHSNAEDGSSTADNLKDDGNDTDAIKAAQTSDYLQDDEDFLNAEDEILYSDPATIASKSHEALITWAVEGLYNENGKVRNKYALRNTPPTFRISSNQGDEAEFVLTKNTSRHLAKLMKDVNNAYYGIKPIEEKTFKEKMVHYWGIVLDNKIKVIIIGSVFLTLLAASIFL